MNDIVAVVLAGGVGKRFWPLTRSKSQFSFFDKTLLFHNLERLKLTGLKKAVIVINPQDLEMLRDTNVPGLSLEKIVQDNPNGMAGAVLCARDLIKEKAVFIMNAEDVVHESLFKTLGHTIGGEAPVIVGKKVSEYFPGGYLNIENGKVIGIVEKPEQGTEPSNLVDLVFDYFPDAGSLLSILGKIKSKRDDIFEMALDAMLHDGTATVISYDNYWYPMKYPWHVLDVMNYFLDMLTKSYRGRNVQVKSNVVIEGPVYIEDNVRIFENTKIVGPCYIGRDTIIGNNNIIRHSHIGAGCVTGFNTDITRSYVGNGCWFHSNYIGDSVLEENVTMGSGTVLANLRLDEGSVFSTIAGKRMDAVRTKLGAIIGKNVRIGVNASIMPGVKIGKDSFIGAGIVIDKDIPDGSFAIGKTTLEIQRNTRFAHPSRDEFKKKI